MKKQHHKYLTCDSPSDNHHKSFTQRAIMESIPISGLDELDKHLDDLIQDVNLALNPKLFDDVELQLTGRF
jgi:hypothetical protein